MSIPISKITASQKSAILTRSEGHFLDMKGRDIKPSKMSQTLSAFANADGGECYVGISQRLDKTFEWDGFASVEDANAHLQVIDDLFPIGQITRCTFLFADEPEGFVLHCEVDKAGDIRYSSDGSVYLRRGAQNLRQDTDEKIERLKLNKGLKSHEDQTIQANIEEIANSKAILEFILDAVPTAEPEPWLRKQKLISGNDLPTVAGLLLFADEPQTAIPKASIKVYRYKTSDAAGTRDTLAFDPKAVEGNAYNQIYRSVALIKSVTEEIPLLGAGGLEKIDYPTEAIHEIITNAVIHRDYSYADDIHVRIFDNRIEVQSPGTLPGHVTVRNILDERASRNPRVVRLLNKFTNPPNKDVGEGLNTAFEAMKRLKLKEPVIEQHDNSVLIILKHERLASPDQIIVEYLQENEEINNSTARRLCSIGSENTVKRIFAKMVKAGVINRIPDRPQIKAGYRRGPNFPKS
jgi:ATP-dependent DNA helicase RecG